MTPERHHADVADLKRALARAQVLGLGLGAVCLLLCVAVLNKQTTVVLEPPSRSRTISVTGDRVDGAWLEEMAIYVAHMMLDATPRSIRWQQEQVLKWTHPATHGELEQRMAVQAKRLIEANATTIFWPQQIAADVDGARAVLLGHLDTYVNGQIVEGSGRTVAYQAGFESKAGRALLKEWKEVPTDDPWLLKALEQQLAAEEAKAKERSRAP